jgi:hypothetical protein
MSDESTGRVLTRALARHAVPELPPSFERTVLERARQEQSRRLTARGRRWMLAYIAVALPACALIVAHTGLPSLPPGAVLLLAPLSFAATLAAPALIRLLVTPASAGPHGSKAATK